MKTTILKFFIPILSLGLLLSSCLGDNENTLSATNAFAYIDDHNGEKIAIVDNNYVALTHENLSTLEVGDCAYLNYKFSTANTSGSGIYRAEYITVNQDEDYDFTLSNQKRIIVASVDTTSISDSIRIFSSINRMSSVIYPFLGNRMLFSCSYRSYENEEVDFQFYYDAGKQGDDVENFDNEGRIIDVRLTKNTIPGRPQGNAAARTKLIAVDFSNVYSMFEQYKDKDYFTVPIQLRYYKSYGTGYPLRTEKLNIYISYDRTAE